MSNDVPAPNPQQDANGLTIVRFYTEDDPVVASVDNRPLADLAQRDEDLNDKIEAVETDTTAAHGPYNSLEERFDAIEGNLPPFSAETLQGLLDLHRPEVVADFLRRRAWSGFLPIPLLTKFNPGIWRGFHTFPSHSIGGSILPVSFDRPRDLNAVVNGWMLSLVDEAPVVASSSMVFQLPVAPNMIDPCGYPIHCRRDFCFIEVYGRVIDPADVQSLADGFHKYGGVENSKVYDHKDATVRHTLYFQPDGKWVQIVWRKRVVDDIDDNQWYNGFECGHVVAQGGNVSVPVGGSTFTAHPEDPGLYVCNGPGTAAYNDVVYAIPVAFVNRRNIGVYSKTNPNGCMAPGPVGGTVASGVSGHPAGYFYDAIYEIDILDRRYIALWDERDLEARTKSALVDLLRGELRTAFGFSQADPDGNLMPEDLGPRGNRVHAIDALSPVVFNSDEKVNWLSINSDGVSQVPDGVRQQWDNGENIQLTPFTFVEGDDNSEAPANLCTYDPLTQTVTLQTTGLSGAPIISPQNVEMRWASNGALVQLASAWSGLGSTSAVCKIFAQGHTGDIVMGRVELVYPRGSGLRHAMHRVLRVDDYAETNRFSFIQTPIEEALIPDNGMLTYPAPSLGRLVYERVAYTMPITTNVIVIPRPLTKAGTDAHLSEIRNANTKQLLEVSAITVNPGNWTITLTSAQAAGTAIELDFEAGPGVNGSRVFYFCGSRHAMQAVTKWVKVTMTANGISSRFRPRYTGNGLVQGTAGLNMLAGAISGLSKRNYAVDSTGVVRPFTLRSIDALGPYGWQYLDVMFDSAPPAGELVFYLIVTDAPASNERLMFHYEHVPYQGEFITRAGSNLRGVEVVSNLDSNMIASILGSQVCQMDPIDPIDQLPAPVAPLPVESHTYSQPGFIRVGIRNYVEQAVNRSLRTSARDYGVLLWLPATMAESPVQDQLMWHKHPQIAPVNKIDLDIVPAGQAPLRGYITFLAAQDEFAVMAEPLDSVIPHWTAYPILVQINRKMYLMVLTGYTVGSQNVVSTNFVHNGAVHDTYCAFDFFELPGRPLMKG